MDNHTITDAVKPLIDVASILTIFGTLMNALPAVAALLSVIWSVIRIYETDTVQRLLGKDIIATKGEE